MKWELNKSWHSANVNCTTWFVSQLQKSDIKYRMFSSEPLYSHLPLFLASFVFCDWCRLFTCRVCHVVNNALPLFALYASLCWPVIGCRSFPSLLEFTSYTFSYHMILCGPFCFYQDYITFIHGTNYNRASTDSSSTATV